MNWIVSWAQAEPVCVVELLVVVAAHLQEKAEYLLAGLVANVLGDWSMFEQSTFEICEASQAVICEHQERESGFGLDWVSVLATVLDSMHQM